VLAEAKKKSARDHAFALRVSLRLRASGWRALCSNHCRRYCTCSSTGSEHTAAVTSDSKSLLDVKAALAACCASERILARFSCSPSRLGSGMSAVHLQRVRRRCIPCGHRAGRRTFISRSTRSCPIWKRGVPVDIVQKALVIHAETDHQVLLSHVARRSHSRHR